MSDLRPVEVRGSVDIKLWNVQIRPGEWMAFQVLVNSIPLEIMTYELTYTEDGQLELHGTKPIPFKSWEELNKQVVWEGVEYPSISACAAALGMTRKAISYRLRKGLTMGNQLRRGTWISNSKPVIIEGEYFTSRTAAAKALGVSISTITRWVAQNEKSMK